MNHFFGVPLTAAMQRAAGSFRDDSSISGLFFLEAWELGCVPDLSAMLRARQIRRSNPALAAEIRAELLGLRRFGQGTPAIAGVSLVHTEPPIHS